MKRIMKYWWILVILALILVVWGMRERFETYADALKDVGQTVGYTSLTPKCPEGSALNTEKTMCKFTDASRADVIPTCSSDTLEFVGGTCRPKPGSVTSTTTATETTGRREAVGGPPPPSQRVTHQEPTEDYADPICPTGTSLDFTKRCRYPGESEMPTCPDGYVLTAGQKCRKIGGTEEIDPQCPVGKVFDGNNGQPGWGCIKQHATPTCPTGYSLRVGETGNTCFKPRAPPPANTTGGSTTTTGRNASGATGTGVTPASVRKNTILGPVFTSYGSPIDGSPDSHKTNQYPELLGGGDPASRNRESGAGGGFGMSIDLKGSMPTADGLGSTEQSKFFPFSRQPGDMELIPDPYRVSQQFSSSSYSFKTEPTPFLTDFSAFLR